MKEKVTNRARSMGELGAFLGQVFRRDEIESAIASYHPRSSDIVFSPFSKCDTTWLQQTFHTMRARRHGFR